MARLLNEADFEKEVLQADVPVVVDFFATWCGPCKIIAPVLDEIAQEIEGKTKIFKVDVDQAKGLAKQYAIRGVPTLLFFKDGDVVDKFSGVLSKDDIVNKIMPWM
ncbi:MAG: thioredoxin [Defluviitaleaceae bacterium]|nr:thioredoxin [Defluviitaleaceae bacterium]